MLLLDPWIEDIPAYPKGYELKKVDAIAISHAHFDHVNDVIPVAKKFSPKVVATFETASFFQSKGVKNTIGLNKGGTADLGFVKLTMTHALHSCSIKEGDQLLNPELAFPPIGDHFAMGPHEAAHASRLLRVKTVIPMHYGTFPALTGTPEALAEKVAKDGITVQVLKQAEPFPGSDRDAGFRRTP